MTRLRFRLYTPIAPHYSWERLSRAWEEMRRINGLPKGQRTLLDRFFLWALRKRWDREVQRYGGGIGWRAQVGERVVFGHGFNGVHLARQAVIGDDTTIMQNVTIGANINRDGSVREDEAPVIGKGVFVGAGAHIIGRCVIGDGARIGAGVVLTNVVVPAGAVVVNKSAYDLTNKRHVYPQD